MIAARVARLLDGEHETSDTLELDFDARLVRRKRLQTTKGRDLLFDLPAAGDLGNHAAVELEDGTRIAIRAAQEDVLIVRGDLPRLAWHIGNRHTPCAFAGDALVIRDDPVLRAMLEGLGAAVEADRRPFRPEGGAYGQGRTMGHDHAHP